MKRLKEPKNYDDSLLQIRLRYSQDDYYNVEYQSKICVGGPGKLLFKCENLKQKYHQYNIGRWIRGDNYSVPIFVNEWNAILRHYFSKIQGWSPTMCDLYMPTVLFDDYYFKISSPKKLDELTRTKMNLSICTDPNLSIALRMLGLSDDDNDAWWGGLRRSVVENRELLFIDDWDSLMAKAQYPVEKVKERGWLWDVYYQYDVLGGPEAPGESKVSVSAEKTSREEQVIAILTNEIFPAWKKADLIDKYELTYKSNEIDPTIRQLHVWLHGKPYWYRLSLTFSRLLLQLFNWNERFLDNGNTLLLKKSEGWFEIDMSKKAPPPINFLADRPLVSPNYYPEPEVYPKTDGRLMHVVVAKPHFRGGTQLVSFYHYQEAPLSIAPAETVCPSGENVCDYPRSYFKLPKNHSFNLESTAIEVGGRILSSDLTSLKKTAPIAPAREIVSSMVKRVDLKLGDYIIDSSGDHFAMRNFLLKRLVYPKFNEDDFGKANPDVFRGSKKFEATIYPFRYGTAPPYYLLSKDELTLEITFQKADYFLVDTRARGIGGRERVSQYQLNLTSKKVELEGASMTDEKLVRSLEFVRYRHHPLYNFSQWSIERVILPKGEMRYTTEGLFKRTGASRFFVCLCRSRNIEDRVARTDPFELNTFGLVSIELREGDTDFLVDKPLLLPENQLSREEKQRQKERTVDIDEVFRRFLLNRDKRLPGITKEAFRKSYMIFSFNRQADQNDRKERGRVVIELTFNSRLTEDTELYCLAETETWLELNFEGKIYESNLASDEVYTEEDVGEGVRSRRAIDEIPFDLLAPEEVEGEKAVWVAGGGSSTTEKEGLVNTKTRAFKLSGVGEEHRTRKRKAST